jgi:hypothetical protein
MRILRLLVAALVVPVAVAACSGGSKSHPDPSITALTPASGTAGTSITIQGSHFGAAQGLVRFGGATATSITAWSDAVIVAVVPDSAYPGGRAVTVETSGGRVSDPTSFQVFLPRVVYVNADAPGANAIAGYAISPANGVATLAGSPWIQPVAGVGYAGYGATLALHTPSRRAFSVAHDRLDSWDINPQTGVLTTTGLLALPAGDATVGLTPTADGSLLFMTTYGNSSVLVVSVPTNGTMSQIAGSPFPAVAASGLSYTALTVDGTRLYALNEFQPIMQGYSIASNGSLSALPGSPYQLHGRTGNFVRAPAADRFYVAELTSGFISTYAPLSTGEFVENVAMRVPLANAIGVALDDSGSRLFAVGRSSQLFEFDIAANGALSTTPGAPFTLPGVASGSIIGVSHDGSVVFVKDVSQPQFHLFSLATNGTPAALSGSPFTLPTGSTGSGVAFTF